MITFSTGCIPRLKKSVYPTDNPFIMGKRDGFMPY